MVFDQHVIVIISAHEFYAKLLGSVNKCQLIRRRSIIGSLLGIEDNVVAKSQLIDELFERGMILMIRIIEHFVHIWIIEINITLLRLSCIDVRAIDSETSGELAELHDVASQCTSFVREDIFDLA